ncbi:Uncharacterized protein HSRCO_3018 (plasmid) [Halanaeroarchaeum sp. HSR-CO]|uniref:hypothetical protein n=1 Tax=Halanaeroarchaeum sp. HSR-CO TaxID=2866382 RepID=UPI00217DF828|nr:hypothetical protein [Halanaeroarchaeum sp. HSR-CO]UWG49159.1 Uncharacterized protein HSRCO_3018 [Halanaeroarchaeum sp. HSR-CO]
MKSGTGDDPFAEDETEEPDDQSVDRRDDQDDVERSLGDVEETTDSRTSIPYKFRRDTVKEERGQIQFFLRDFVLEMEDDFVDDLETELGEDVYVTDAREAAIIFAMRNPDEVAEIMREWGYDFE